MFIPLFEFTRPFSVFDISNNENKTNAAAASALLLRLPERFRDIVKKLKYHL